MICMKKKIIYALLIVLIFIGNISSGDTGTENAIITLNRTDLLIFACFFLGSLVAFGVGGAHEWHLTLQDIRIEEGKITNTQRHQLLAGFKDRASLWMGIISGVVAFFATQAEKFSESVSFVHILSSFMILFGPYLVGRLIYILYLHGAEYRKNKTTASKNFLPVYFTTLSAIICIVNYYSVVELVSLLGGDVAARSGMHILYLSTKILTAMLVCNFIDQTIITLRMIKAIDRAPESFARVSPELSRMMGYGDILETVQQVEALSKIQVADDGRIDLSSMDGSRVESRVEALSKIQVADDGRIDIDSMGAP